MINNYFEEEEDEYHPSDEIFQHPVHGNCLHLGDMSAAVDVQGLQSMNIRTVITAAAFMDHIEYEPSSQIRHVVYALDDVKSENISQHFNPVYELIERELEKGSVLVHCAAGVSRSATLVIAYLMKHKNWTFHEAIAYVRTSRPKVCPNLGFERQLKEYERNMFKKKNQRSFVRKGPKTSEESKHISKKIRNIELPEIASLGRTQIRNIVFDPFNEKKETRASQRNRAPLQISKVLEESEDFTFKLRPLKVRKAKSLVDKSDGKVERVPLYANLNLVAQSVFINRVNLGQIKTERVRRRHLVNYHLPKESYGL